MGHGGPLANQCDVHRARDEAVRLVRQQRRRRDNAHERRLGCPLVSHLFLPLVCPARALRRAVSPVVWRLVLDIHLGSTDTYYMKLSRVQLTVLLGKSAPIKRAFTYFDAIGDRRLAHILSVPVLVLLENVDDGKQSRPVYLMESAESVEQLAFLGCVVVVAATKSGISDERLTDFIQ